MSTKTRREVLASTGRLTGSVLAIGGATVAAGVVAAGHRDKKPEHVTLSYDEAVLEEYQPLLVLTEEDRSRLIGQYAWTATSPEYETDCHVYWTTYTHQTGFSGYDSHLGDHEPAYVFVDSETGDVEQVVASIYHWLRGLAPATSLRLENESNPVLKVIDPWHQYTAPPPDVSAYRSSLADLDGVYDDWLANGLEDALEPGVVVNPWRMHGSSGRGHWWQDTVGGFSKDAFVMGVLRTAGVHEAGSL